MRRVKSRSSLVSPCHGPTLFKDLCSRKTFAHRSHLSSILLDRSSMSAQVGIWTFKQYTQTVLA